MFRGLSAGGRWIRTSGTADDARLLDSALEGDGFEPSVPRQIFSAARRSPRKFTFRNFRNINRVPRASRILARADIALQRGCPDAHPSRRVMRDVKFEGGRAFPSPSDNGGDRAQELTFASDSPLEEGRFSQP